MKILHLTLKKKWFDLIASGEKKEEYREIKPYWCVRLMDKTISTTEGDSVTFKRWFDFVKFTNGYGKCAPSITLKWEGVEIGEGNPEWGAEPGTHYFKIKLGESVTVNNQ
jgi:hypothetical protein